MAVQSVQETAVQKAELKAVWKAVLMDGSMVV
jgi:hypothetical protein